MNTCHLSGTWAEEDQAGLQSLQLNLRLEVVDFHGAEDLTHGHVQLIQTSGPTVPWRHLSENKSYTQTRMIAFLLSQNAHLP